MAVYMGGKKVKELYYNGKKIKEAWYGSKKVYSSGPDLWKNGTLYRRGDLVTGSQGRIFTCITDHYADPDTEPWVGISESGFWKIVSG
ncbi:hypothetical protein [Corynebacterium guaraldiae]|uniref:hypothetical protein n=1 Tax=Corynebacterium guaraldiae TaxID=3051103 RepID=UPI001186123C|nr:hypothetical protein [Corynebacterium guaraldiae]TRX51513.1 hypothetical protein FNY91_09355 [Corynebacterium guaraldiae]